MKIGVCEWHRYISDIFVLIELTTNVSDVLHILNNYPLSFTNVHIAIGLSRYLIKRAEKNSPSTLTTTTTTPATIELNRKRMYVEIPYVRQTTYSIRSKFTHLSSKRRPDLVIRYFIKPPPSVQFFFQSKDRIDQHLQSNIVYSVYSKDCEQTHVAKTDRQVIRRTQEHGAPSSTFEQQATADRDTNEDRLRRSSRIRGKIADS
jgi:alpha-glucosidase (family GH31 glycosyl hydrolase)